MGAKEINVKCSFCGKEIPCPENMIKSQKHACFECFMKIKDKLDPKEVDRIHVVIPKEKLQETMPDMLINYAMQKAFPDFWNDHKSKFKDMSKKEIVEESFLAGAKIILNLKEDFEKEMTNKNSKYKNRKF